MTFRSSWITLNDGSRAPGTTPRAGAAKAVTLPDSAGGSFSMLKAWAKAAGLAVEYVDNAWVYVSVSKAQLLQLLDTWLVGDQTKIAATLTDIHEAYGIENPGPFFVDAEEF